MIRKDNLEAMIKVIGYTKSSRTKVYEKKYAQFDCVIEVDFNGSGSINYPEDKGKSDNRPEGIMIRCRNCGRFIIRKSNRQEFCDAEECQKVRNARKQKAYRERKAIEKAQKSKEKAH